MNKQSFLKYFPTFLILISVALWANSLLFSPVTNHYEKKLESYWQENLERGSNFLDFNSHNTQLSIEKVF